jgi:hypothetical protein
VLELEVLGRTPVHAVWKICKPVGKKGAFGHLVAIVTYNWSIVASKRSSDGSGSCSMERGLWY